MVSKTKLSAVLIGTSAILGTLGSYFSGNLVLFDMIKQLITEVGGVLGVFGIRDWEIVKNN